ncbi:cellulase family protein [Purpureocillium lavendulum]|uniref:Cellulase family protein n=1 Tax=Purpureocillium lavendulum TaxID=1247861 RepID=A0AB34G0T3_9HYPO|nr:cellulase family protein [Purpureocillium lavendulum]
MRSSLVAAFACFGGALLGLASGTVVAAAADKPKVPLSVSGRWIVDSTGQRVKLRCINWAGHLEANVPEGLHRQSVEGVAGWIAAQGYNCVRLTYSIDMARNPTLGVEASFRAAAAASGADEAAVMALYAAARERNPFLGAATVLDVFDRVQAALWDRGVMTILDNHVSRASWCCDLGDGNGWWSDARFYMKETSRYFDTAQWHDGLAAMAAWSRARPGVVGLSLRNELRASVLQIPFAPRTWLAYMPAAARIVHAAAPDALVIVGGINGGTDLSPLRTVGPMDMSTGSGGGGSWAAKRVWEAHAYSFTITTPSFGICPLLKAEYGGLFGFVLEQDRGAVTGPLFLSEFGVGMTGGPHDGLSDDDYKYLTCLVEYMEDNDADWAHWAVQGSYYVRGGSVDYNETWGALDYDWQDWRNPKFKAMLGKMPDVTQGP